MTVFSRFAVVRSALAALLSVTAGGASAVQSRYNLAPPITSVANEVYSLHNMMLIICTAIFIAVFSVMFYSIWKHRKSKGAVAANWHENTTVEIVWTVIPFIIVIVMALPAYDQCIKASHLFNLLDARGVISVTERQAYIGRVRALAKACADAFVAASA